MSLINGKRRVSKYSLSAGKYIAKVTQSIFISTINSKYQFKQIHASVPFDVKEPDTREQDALELFKERPLFRDDIESSQTLSQLGVDSQQRVLSDWKNSEENYKNVYTLYPDTPYALYSLYYCGRLAQESGRLEQACGNYRRVLRESPDFPLRADLLYFLADCSLRLRQRDTARKYFDIIQIPFTKVLVSPTITYFEKIPRMATLERVLATP